MKERAGSVPDNIKQRLASELGSGAGAAVMVGLLGRGVLEWM